MTSNQLADLVLYHTGHIVATSDTEAKCKVCEGIGTIEHPAPGFTYPNVQHKRRCSGLLCVKDFLHDAKGANFLLEVENVVPSEDIEDYEEMLTPTDLREIEQLTNAVFMAASKEDLEKVAEKLAMYDNHDGTSPVLQRIMKHGIETPTERENLKSFLICLRAHKEIVDDFMMHAMDMEQERTYMAHLFDQAFPV